MKKLRHFLLRLIAGNDPVIFNVNFVSGRNPQGNGYKLEFCGKRHFFMEKTSFMVPMRVFANSGRSLRYSIKGDFVND